MDSITGEAFDKAQAEAKGIKPERKEEPEITDDEMAKMLNEMDNPVLAQKKVAVQIKIFLDKQMKADMRDRGYLTESTRKWIESFNSILDKIQKALHGEKSVNINLSKVTHGDISEKIRESVFIVESGKGSKKSKKSED